MSTPRRRLTAIDRTMIEVRLCDGWSVRAIATALGRSPGTISKEIQRHSDGARYHAQAAELRGVLHALCNAHHLRELAALVEIEREDWARRMQTLLRRACHAANLARHAGKPVPPALIALIERCYDRIVADGKAFHEAQPALAAADPHARRRGRAARRIGHNLLLRLDTRKMDVLRFLSDARVPFTNNLAERDGRMMKLRQKISGGFRGVTGAQDFAIIRSVISTAKKQQWDVLQTIIGCSSTLPNHLQTA